VRLTDRKLKKHVGTYVFQCSLAALAIFIVLISLDASEQTAIIASIGASAFIVFTAPNAFSAKFRSLIGGYVIGAVIGIGCSLVVESWAGRGSADWGTAHIAMGALAVGLSTFLMVVTDTEHPPAAGLALAFVLNSWNFMTVLVVILSPLVLALVKYLFRDRIRDLV
jgi:CBS-domain-containing membrane protein